MLSQIENLSTEKVTLRLLQLEDLDSLYEVSSDHSVFEFFPHPIPCNSKPELAKWITSRLELFNKEEWLPFVIIQNETGKVIGTTSFLNISIPNSRIEIGATWLGIDYQGKGYNMPSKYLLMSYAFEVLKVERLELKTDALNIKSRKAIQKIGAKEEGVLRSHTLMQKNRRRDTVYYSILSNEWEEIKNTIFNNITYEI